MTRLVNPIFEEKVLTAEYLADPYQYYCLLRSETPVCWSERLGSWVLSRYPDVVGALRDPQLFSNAGRMAAMLDKLPESSRQNLGLLYEHYSAGLIFADPPDHSRLRSLVGKAFSPAVVERLRPQIHSIINTLLDGLQSKEKIDLIAEFAYPLPSIVICELLGLPKADRDQFRLWTEDIIALLGAGADAARAEKGQRSLKALRAYYRELIAERQAKPGPDLVSALIVARDQDQRLNEAELLSTCVTLLTAGQETTTGLIANGVLALLNNPEQRRALEANPDLMPNAVEEFLRFDCPVQRQLRIATRDIELGGQFIRAGEIVSPFLGAANRDPAQFPDPDCLDLERRDLKHTAFGYGIHFCLGAPLARLEVPIALRELLRRFPNLRGDGSPLRWVEDVTVRRLTSLPLELAA